MPIDLSLVKELRERTGAGVIECRTALVQTNGDLTKAVEYLRQKGAVTAAKKAGRVTQEGLIGSYIHPGGKIGVLVELNCETDFVARTNEFQDLLKNISLQIAGADPPPRYVKREEIPPDVLEKEKAAFQAEAAGMGKPPHVVEKIVEGRLENFYKEVCLLEQPFIRDPEMTISDLIAQRVAQLRENIRVHRFVRYRLGENE